MIARLSLSSIKNLFTKKRSFLANNDQFATSFIALQRFGSGGLEVFPWNSTTGFGTEYNFPSSVGALPSVTAGVAWSPSGQQLVSGNGALFRWNSGFVSRYTSPTPFLTSDDVAFSPSGNDIAFAHTSSPFIGVWPFNSSTGYGTKYANPATLPTGTGHGIKFSPSAAHIAVAHSSSPFISAYPWSSGYGTKYSNPATAIPNAGNDVAFNPSGNTIAVAHTSTPFISVYPWSSGFGTKYANPATLPTVEGISVTFSPSGADIIIGHHSSPYASAYPFSSGFGTKYANPATAIGNQGFSVDFSGSGSEVAIGSFGGTINVYRWTSGTGFGTKYSSPPAGGSIYGVEFKAV